MDLQNLSSDITEFEILGFLPLEEFYELQRSNGQYRRRFIQESYKRINDPCTWELAVRCEDPEMLEALLKKNHLYPELDTEEETARRLMELAVAEGSPKIINYLLKKYPQYISEIFTIEESPNILTWNAMIDPEVFNIITPVIQNLIRVEDFESPNIYEEVAKLFDLIYSRFGYIPNDVYDAFSGQWFEYLQLRTPTVGLGDPLKMEFTLYLLNIHSKVKQPQRIVRRVRYS